MPDELSTTIEMEQSRVRHAFWLAIAGLLIIGLLTIALVVLFEHKISKLDEMVGIISLFTNLLSAVIGMFFGLQVGSVGMEHERRSRRHAERLTRHALAHLTPDVVRDLLREHDHA